MRHARARKATSRLCLSLHLGSSAVHASDQGLDVLLVLGVDARVRTQLRVQVAVGVAQVRQQRLHLQAVHASVHGAG